MQNIKINLVPLLVELVPMTKAKIKIKANADQKSSSCNKRA
jgi:hypothetical protein